MPRSRMMDQRHFQRALAEELERGEQVLWRGQPIARYAVWSGLPARSRRGRALLVITAAVVVQPFCLPGYVFAASAIEGLAAPDSIGHAMGLSVVLLLAGVGALVPYWLLARGPLDGYRSAREVHYVLTDRRALIFRMCQGQVKELDVRALRHIDRPRLKALRRNGIGDVLYATGGFSTENSESSSTHWEIGFEAVADAQQVYEQLCAACPPVRKPPGIPVPGDR